MKQPRPSLELARDIEADVRAMPLEDAPIMVRGVRLRGLTSWARRGEIEARGQGDTALESAMADLRAALLERARKVKARFNRTGQLGRPKS